MRPGRKQAGCPRLTEVSDSYGKDQDSRKQETMTWIKTIPPKEADEKLREAMQRYKQLYPIEYRSEVEILKPMASRETGGSISDSHSLLPDTLYHAFATLGTLLSPELPLTRRQHEMIATLVSVVNDCFY